MTTDGAQVTALDDHTVVVARYDDAISSEGRTLVLHESTVLLLSEVSSAALHHAIGGITVADLGARLLDEFGPPPQGGDVPHVTRQIVAALEWHGLLTRRVRGEQSPS
jgi:hypothetical protein